MRAGTMSKPKRFRTDVISSIEPIEVESTSTPEPTVPTVAIGADIEPSVIKPRRYVPPVCAMCAALGRVASDTEVYCTRHECGYTIRFCRCRRCPNTFKAPTTRIGEFADDCNKDE